MQAPEDGSRRTYWAQLFIDPKKEAQGQGEEFCCRDLPHKAHALNQSGMCLSVQPVNRILEMNINLILNFDQASMQAGTSLF